MSWMYGRTSSMPAGTRSGATTTSSTLNRYGGQTATSSSSSYGNTNNYSRSNATAYDRDASTSGYVPTTSSSSSSLHHNNNSRVMGTTASSSYQHMYGSGSSGMEPSYTSGPQFDHHGHNIRGPTTTSAVTTSSYNRNTPTSTSTTDAYRRLLNAADESSTNASRYNSSLLPPSRTTTTSTSATSNNNSNSRSVADRNPLQFSNEVYTTSSSTSSIANGRRSSQGYGNSTYEDEFSTNNGGGGGIYYRERTGAHNYNNNNSNSSPSSQNRHASAAISSSSSGAARRTLQDYDRYGANAMAYGASVTNNNTASSRHNNNNNAILNKPLEISDDDDDDDEDGVHISAACKNGAGLGLSSKSSSITVSGQYNNNNTSLSSSSSATAIAKKSLLSSSSSSVVLVPVGLRNIGNTCYMNASLQCILQASGFFLSSLPNAINQSASGKSKLTKSLLALAKSSNIQDLMTVKSGAATLNHEFHGGRQNDAHEFIREFLHALHIELNRVGKAPYKEMKDIEGENDTDAARRWFAYFRSHDDSIVTDYFGGFMRATTMCGTCNHRSLSFSPVWDLSLSMSSSGSAGNTIPAMIKDFMKVDILGADGAFSCEKCKKKRQGKRQSMLVNWPRVLVLHLCRFTYSGARNSQSVEFPARIEQDMMPVPSSGSTTITGEAISGYSLSGVVLHRGTASFGHYTALVRPFGGRNWYNCDDASVSQISESEVLRHKTEAYVLFYTMDEI